MTAVLAAMLMSCNSTPSLSVALLSAADMDSMVPLTEAVAIAQEHVPGGVAVEAKLFVAGQNQLLAVEVHAMTGAVLEVEVGEDGPDDEDGDERKRR